MVVPIKLTKGAIEKFNRWNLFADSYNLAVLGTKGTGIVLIVK